MTIPAHPVWLRHLRLAAVLRFLGRSGRPLKRASIVLWLVAALPPVPSVRAGEAAAVPDPYQQTVLIYATLTALDQANLTGNYSVLRDLAAPDFQSQNSPERLKAIFRAYRERRVSLMPVVLYEPRLLVAPRVEDGGLLRLKGYFPTRPLRIDFDLVYESIEGTWRLIGLSISPREG